MSDCLFCKVRTNELPIKKIAENEKAIAFLDAFPNSHGHTLVIPKNHFANLAECPDDVLNDVMKLAKEVVSKLENLNVGIQGFNYLSNHNAIAGQVIMHFHLHIIPKYDEESGIKVSHKEIKNDSILMNKIQSLIIK